MPQEQFQRVQQQQNPSAESSEEDRDSTVTACDTYRLLNVASPERLLFSLAVHGLSAECVYPSGRTWLYIAVGGLASVELSCSLTTLCQARLLEICNIVPVCDCAAVCSRSGFSMFWTLLRVMIRAVCAYPCTSGVTAVFSATLKLFENTSARSFQGVRISPGTSLSLVELEMQIRLLFSLKLRAPCATERLCLVPEAVTQSCRRNYDSRSSSLFHHLAVLFDRIAARRIAIFV